MKDVKVKTGYVVQYAPKLGKRLMKRSYFEVVDTQENGYRLVSLLNPKIQFITKGERFDMVMTKEEYYKSQMESYQKKYEFIANQHSMTVKDYAEQHASLVMLEKIHDELSEQHEELKLEQAQTLKENIQLFNELNLLKTPCLN